MRLILAVLKRAGELGDLDHLPDVSLPEHGRRCYPRAMKRLSLGHFGWGMVWFCGLLCLGCSSGNGNLDSSQPDVAANLDANRVCPGHIDPSSGIGLTIKTSDDLPTIASVSFMSNGTYPVGFAPCSYFNIEKPDASASGGYSQVTIYRGSNLFIDSTIPVGSEPEPCSVNVLSIDGTGVTVTATVTYHRKSMRHCMGNSNCCDESVLEWVGSIAFSPLVQTITFPSVLDAAADGGVENPSADVNPGEAIPEDDRGG
jgi:hypothetical protein